MRSDYLKLSLLGDRGGVFMGHSGKRDGLQVSLPRKHLNFNILQKKMPYYWILIAFSVFTFETNLVFLWMFPLQI